MKKHVILLLFAFLFLGNSTGAIRIIPNVVHCPQTQLFYEYADSYNGGYLDGKSFYSWETALFQNCDKNQKKVLADVKKKFLLEDLSKADFDGALSYCRTQAMQCKMLGNREWEGIVEELIMRKHMGLTVIQKSTSGNTSRTYSGFDVTNLASTHNEKYGLKLAQEGDRDIQMVMGGYYEGQAIYNFMKDNLKVVADQKAKSAYWYEQAAKNGDVLSQYKTGILYLFGCGVKQNYQKAAEWFGVAANNGHIDAAYLYAVAWYLGKGVQKNEKNAYKWFEIAAKNGHVEASFMYGYMQYLECESQGKGWSIEIALSWFESAARKGNQQAQFMIAYIYAENPVLRDYDEAIARYYIACMNSFYWIIGMSDGLSHYFTLINNIKKYFNNEKCTSEAYNVIAVAAAAYYNRGEIYATDREGFEHQWDLTMKDWKYAANYFQLWIADYKIGRCYLKGMCGMKPDRPKATEWMCKTVEDANIPYVFNIPDQTEKNTILKYANEICKSSSTAAGSPSTNPPLDGGTGTVPPSGKDTCTECVLEECEDCEKCRHCKECEKQCKDKVNMTSKECLFMTLGRDKVQLHDTCPPLSPAVSSTDKWDLASLNMIYVEGGTFIMGCDSSKCHCQCPTDELPLHLVQLKDYYISQTEVTQALWEIVMGENSIPVTSRKESNYPVEKVSWNDCQMFVQKLNALTGLHFQIPSEAQWEYAARGGKFGKDSSFVYAGSNDIDSIACYNSITTNPVGTKHFNLLGLYDMSGNVMEWCLDKKVKYQLVNQINPVGVGDDTNMYVLRGGCWKDSADKCRITYRYASDPRYRMNTFGLRLVLIPNL